MGDDAITAGRRFLISHLTERRTIEQERIEETLRQLVAVEALIHALSAVDVEQAAAHRAACEARRDELVADLSGRLYAWDLAGGRIVLLPPADRPDGERPITGGPPMSVAVEEGPATDGHPAPAAGPAPVDAGDAPLDQPESLNDEPESPAAAPASDATRASAEQLEALRRTMGRWRETSTDWERADRDTAAAQATVQRLARLIGPISLPESTATLTGGLLDAEIDALVQATGNLDAEWGPLPAAYQRPLLSLYTCYVRAIQEHLDDSDPLRPRVTGAFHRLVDFSRSWQPGRVNGLQRMHQPRHGTWLADARDWLTHLRELAGLTAAPERTGGGGTGKGPATIAIDQILRDEGFASADARSRAWTLLEQHNLTQRSKQTMDTAKLPRVRALFQALRPRVCAVNPECADLRRSLFDRTDDPIPVDSQFCDICAGSNNRRAALALVARLRTAGITRLLIVGGGDDSRAELDQLLPEWGIELRHVDGTKESHAQKDADANMRWAQVVVVWGATMLPHKISNLYRDPPDGVLAVNPNRRGIEAMCRAVIEALDRQTARR